MTIPLVVPSRPWGPLLGGMAPVLPLDVSGAALGALSGQQWALRGEAGGVGGVRA